MGSGKAQYKCTVVSENLLYIYLFKCLLLNTQDEGFQRNNNFVGAKCECMVNAESGHGMGVYRNMMT